MVTSSEVVGSSAMMTLRLAGDGDGADHALLHAAADLVRVILDPPVGRRDPHLLQAVDRPPYERALVLVV